MSWIWLLTGAMLLPLCPAYAERSDADKDGSVTNAPVVCNDGALWIGVAWAFKDQRDYIFNNDRWDIRGWNYVAAGKCGQIGEPTPYFSGNILNRTYSLTLLAFVFKDSAGVWGAIRFPDTTDGIFTPSDEQVCVAWDNFHRSHLRSQGGPAADCARSGDFLIPASLQYTADTHYGYYGGQMGYTNTRDYLHVKVDSAARAVPLRPQDSSPIPNNPAPQNNLAPPVNPAPPQSPVAGGDSLGDQMLKGFAKSMVEAIAASTSGFNAYKSGAGITSSGYLMWESKVKPAAAKNCWVVRGDTTATLSCLLSTGDDLNTLGSYYTQLTSDVAALLPQDWKPGPEQPFGGDLPSKSFLGAGGAHGEVWIGRAPSGEKYELHYQLVSAPLAPAPTEVQPEPVDDPIGHGGFITPSSQKP